VPPGEKRFYAIPLRLKSIALGGLEVIGDGLRVFAEPREGGRNKQVPRGIIVLRVQVRLSGDIVYPDVAGGMASP